MQSRIAMYVKGLCRCSPTCGGVIDWTEYRFAFTQNAWTRYMQGRKKGRMINKTGLYLLTNINTLVKKKVNFVIAESNKKSHDKDRVRVRV
jgi:hypothetical protein